MVSYTAEWTEPSLTFLFNRLQIDQTGRFMISIIQNKTVFNSKQVHIFVITDFWSKYIHRTKQQLRTKMHSKSERKGLKKNTTERKRIYFTWKYCISVHTTDQDEQLSSCFTDMWKTILHVKNKTAAETLVYSVKIKLRLRARQRKIAFSLFKDFACLVLANIHNSVVNSK